MGNTSLVGYSDFDFGGCKVDRKSTCGTCHDVNPENGAKIDRRHTSKDGR